MRYLPLGTINTTSLAFSRLSNRCKVQFLSPFERPCSRSSWPLNPTCYKEFGEGGGTNSASFWHQRVALNGVTCIVFFSHHLKYTSISRCWSNIFSDILLWLWWHIHIQNSHTFSWNCIINSYCMLLAKSIYYATFPQNS